MTRVYFVGDMRSPFIRQDKEMLDENHDVVVFDLAKHATSFKQIFKYLIDTLVESRNVFGADIIYIWFADYPALPFVVYSKLFGIPCVVNVGGWEVYAAQDIGYGNQLNPIRGFASRWICKVTDSVIVPSNAYGRIVRDLVPAANVSVIPCCIDTTLCDAPLPAKRGVVTAICTSGTNALKGIPAFLAATSGMEANVIKNISHENLIEAFKHAKVYCQLSRTESCGVSLLEAMACGCVPVVTNCDALPEVVGETGRIVHYNQRFETRRAIDAALLMSGDQARDRAREFSKENRKTILDKMLGELI